ncbi:uncharacterized protein UV8b_02833 [Ustilaginoidea virens]|uniref:Protein FAF1 n=1 Tax=Ustilaginoidea virens TaxID=1159556 RepID=A0A8E5MGI3_USTVR|nr:uncharacterized protein UV8b_02833 [Ustilaginoidea virens]QUC18592.1 hypothetical protein UV8b_02833 [Ustilaginoidea virens]
MAVLGKRKASASSTPPLDADDLLRRHFEARFQPLEIQTAPASKSLPQDDHGHGHGHDHDHEHDHDHDHDHGPDDDRTGSEWEGLSDDDGAQGGAHVSDHDEGSTAVQVVDHSVPHTAKESTMSKRELKAFMSSRPPDQTVPPTKPHPESSPRPSPSSLPEDAPSLLAQDLELRRLLAESHLLAPHAAAKSLSGVSSTPAPPRSFAAGRTRQKATDLRVQALGSTVSVLKQDKMPMRIRKGKAAAADAREAKRRREARENGIVLEREAGKRARRQRSGSGRGGAVDRPGVGRMKGAELRISESDVRGIQGARDVFGRKGRR